MSLTLLIIFFIFGLIIGSFLNVVVCRYHTARSFGGRSMCMNCSEKLCWYDLVPMFSFFALGGRCRHCKSKVSWQYPIVEMLSGVTFALLFFKFQTLFWESTFLFTISFAFYAALFSVLLVLSTYDLKHKIIPDPMVFAFGALSFLSVFLFQNDIFAPHLPNIRELSVGLVAAAPFALLWFVSRGTWMGFGDAKLMLGIGWLLGATRVLGALLVSFGSGFVVGVLMLIFSKRYHLKSEIPFAPFLVLGAILAFIFNLGASNLLFYL